MWKKVLLLCVLFTGILGGCAAPSDDSGKEEDAEGEILTVVEKVRLDSDLSAMEHIQLVGDTLYFPMTEENFRAALEKGQGENEAFFSLFTGERETGLVPTPQDIEDMWKIVEHVYYSDRQQSVISDIISEETGAVFDGKKTSGEAAEKIQNRVSLFLAE